jgi:integrase
MHKNAGHLVDINSVISDDIHRLVISQINENGQQIIVSRYGDSRWDLSPYIQTLNSRAYVIIFDIVLGDGSILTDSQNAILLDAAKRFLYVRWRVKAPHSGKYISARTLFNNWAQLRPLLYWMTREDIHKFSELTPSKCLDYVHYCKSEKKLLGSSQILNYQILTTYYDLNDHLIDKLHEYPWTDTIPTFLANVSISGKNSNNSGTTEVIPLRVLKLIVQKALDYIENRSESLLFARDGVNSIRDKVYHEVMSRHSEKYPCGFSSIYKTEKQYLQVKTGHRANPIAKKWLDENRLPELEGLETELNRLRIACYIICAVFSGMRSSELASLETGCFIRHKGFDDEEYCWLRGKTYKLEEDPKDAEWMVPSIVGKAVEVAEKLSAPLRDELLNYICNLENRLNTVTLLPKALKEASKNLAESRRHVNALFLSKKEDSRTLSYCLVGNSLKDFAKHSGAIVDNPDLAVIKDLSRVNVGDVWNLTPHQFRRTFAVLVARNLMGDVRYLREHFKHWSIDMTLYYSRDEQSYIDETVFTEVLTQRDELQTLILEKWLSSNAKLSGGTGRRLVSFRGRDEVKTVKDMREFCRKLGEDVFIRGTGHSWCMCSDTGSSGHCLYDAIRCNSCEDSVIDDTHIQVWRGIRQQQIEVLMCPDLGESIWQRCVNHLREAEKILRELGDTPEPFTIPEHPYATEEVS